MKKILNELNKSAGITIATDCLISQLLELVNANDSPANKQRIQQIAEALDVQKDLLIESLAKANEYACQKNDSIKQLQIQSK